MEPCGVWQASHGITSHLAAAPEGTRGCVLDPVWHHGDPRHHGPISRLPEGMRRQHGPSTGALLPKLCGRAGALAWAITASLSIPGR